MRIARSVLFVLALFGTVGCDSVTAPMTDMGPPVQTESGSFSFSEIHHSSGALIGYQVTIPSVFTNQTSAPVFISSCGGIGTLLEKKVAGEWTHFFAPGLLGCLADPIVVEPSSSHSYSTVVGIALPGTPYLPQMDPDELTGTFRIVWTDVLTSIENYPSGQKVDLEYRVSNEFQLVRD